MGRRRGLLLAAGLILATLLAVSRRPEPRPREPLAATPGRASELRTAKPPRGIDADWRRLVESCRHPVDPAERQRALAATKERWLAEDPRRVAARIGRLLQRGEDAATGLPFETGPGGALVGWPTLRVFLLDVLAVTDPDLAGSIAREVLDTTPSAAEFAVALKPLLLGGVWQSSDEELGARFSKLLGHPDWQTEVGLAEALDLARAAAIPATTALLARWVDGDPVAARAGEMALHETAAARPDLLVGLLAGEPGLLDDRPGLRASLLARATVSDPGQAAEVQSYLADPAVPLAEKRDFLRLFPLRATTTGHRLYGKPHAPFDHDAIRGDDRAALDLVQAWRARPELAPLAGDLASAEQRLRDWVDQSRR